MINTEKHNLQQPGINPFTAALTGAVVGAGVAVAGMFALKDKKNREMVKDVFNNVKDQAVGYIETVQHNGHNTKAKINNKMPKRKSRIMKLVGKNKEVK